MSAVFLRVLNMSITAGWLILAVMLARLILKKAPKWISCLLWGLVAVRLICPFSFESVLSLIPSGETIPANIAEQHEPAITSGVSIINEAVNPIITRSFTPAPADSSNPLQGVIPIAAIIWIIGTVMMLSYALISYLKLKKTVSVCVPVGERLFICDDIAAPFILGVLRPRIYVPSGLGEPQLSHVLSHEQAHLKRRDHWWKPLGFLLLSVYWFNPLCWIAYILLCRDIEAACDERVVRDMDRLGKAAYSQALLDCALPRRSIAACPLAFGEVGVKERVKEVLNYKKPAFWVIAAALVICAAVAVCFLTNPKSDSTPFGKYYVVNEILHEADVFSFSFTVETAPRYYLTEDRELRVTENRRDWANAGVFEETALTAETFDRYFQESFTDRARQLRERTKSAWVLDVSGNSNAVFYYLLRQDDALLLTYGYRMEDGGAFIRWVFRLSEYDGDTAETLSGEHETVIKTAYVGYSYSDVISHCLNAPQMSISTVRHLPVYKLESVEDLARFRDTFEDAFTFGTAYGDTQSFDEASAGYNESFFEEKSVVLAYIGDENASLRYSIRDIENDGSSLCLSVSEAVRPELYTADELGWLLIAEIPREEIQNVTGFDAEIDARIDPKGELLNEIMSSPAYSSVAQNYINEHPTAYQKLLDDKTGTLQYIFAEFLYAQRTGSYQTGLKGAIMRIILDELAPEAALDTMAPTGQDYFDMWFSEAQRLRAQHGDKWMRDNQPEMLLLLEMA